VSAENGKEERPGRNNKELPIIPEDHNEGSSTTQVLETCNVPSIMKTSKFKR